MINKRLYKIIGHSDKDNCFCLSSLRLKHSTGDRYTISRALFIQWCVKSQIKRSADDEHN